MRRGVLYIQGVTRMGGSIKSLLLLLENLDRSRWSPFVVTSSRGEFTEELEKRGVPYQVIRLGMWRKVKNWPMIPLSLRTLRKIISREHISIVHCNTMWDHPYGYHAARPKGIPTICHLRGSVGRHHAEKYLLHHAYRLVAISDYVASLMPGELKDRVCVIKNAVDLESMRTRENRKSVRKIFGIDEDGPVVGMVSRLDPLKGQDTLLKAAAVLKERYPDLKVVLAGDTSKKQKSYRAHLEHLASLVEIKENVLFLGHQRNVEDLTGAFDVAVLPSRDEGLGRSIMEAMAAGIPTVASRVGGIPELVEDGVTGFLVPPDDHLELARAIDTILANASLMKKMGEAARRKAEREFDIRDHAMAVQDLYDAVVSEAG